MDNWPSDPMTTFSEWYNETTSRNEIHPDTMALATLGQDLRPSVRFVYFKGIRGGGFSFFTNYEGRKGREVKENPRAALAFYWLKQRRQVRVEGHVVPLSIQESDDYFKTRERPSQITAIFSKQSQVLTNHQCFMSELNQKDAETEEVTRPMHWGGFKLIPERMEFWTGGPHRRHLRVDYFHVNKSWQYRYLYP